MLIEQKDVAPDAGRRRRRSFTGDWFEIYVTYDHDGSVFGIQLIYLEAKVAFFALVWTKTEGYGFYSVSGDSGGSDRWDYDRALAKDLEDAFDKDSVLARLESASAGLDPEVRDLLLEKVKGYPVAARRCERCPEKRVADTRCYACAARWCTPCTRKDPHAPDRCAATGRRHLWAARRLE